jgi:hypothetical protein
LRPSARVLTTIVVCGLAACQSADAPMNEDGFCAEYARRECQALVNSCVLPAADCERVRKGVCLQEAQRSRTDVRAFRPENVDACLAKVTETYSQSVITPTLMKALRMTCSRVFAGRAKQNETCMVDEDCDAPLICDKRRCGVMRMVAAGANCGNPGELCPAGEYCRQSDGFWVCTRRKESDGLCGEAEPCFETLRCRGTCVPRLPLAANCEADDDCLSGYCSPHVSPKVCAPGLQFALGSPSCRDYFGQSGGAPDAGAAADGS